MSKTQRVSTASPSCLGVVPVDSVQATPFLKWLGGKSRLLKQYAPYIPPQFNRYYESFVGGGAMFFSRPQAEATLSDINPDLVNVYIHVRDQVEPLIAELQSYQEQHGPELYKLLAKQRFEEQSLNRAARFCYLNKAARSGMYRENKKGEFNVPWGSYPARSICNPVKLRAASAALQGVEILCADYAEILEQAQPGDFVFADPPYYPISKTSDFTSYTAAGFSSEDQVLLRDRLAAAANRGVLILAANSDCEATRLLYQDFKIHSVLSPRAINSNVNRRGPVSELIIQLF